MEGIYETSLIVPSIHWSQNCPTQSALSRLSILPALDGNGVFPNSRISAFPKVTFFLGSVRSILDSFPSSMPSIPWTASISLGPLRAGRFSIDVGCATAPVSSPVILVVDTGILVAGRAPHVFAPNPALARILRWTSGN